jgi:hypothetical protein
VIPGLTATLTLGDTEVVIRELTTAETRDQLAEFERGVDLSADLRLVYAQLADPQHQLALRCLQRMTSLDVKAVPDLPFSGWRAILVACVECNPGFFQLAGVLQRLGQATPTPAETSSEPSASS